MNKPNIYLLTGPIHSGKTTALLNWANDKKHVTGVLSPDVDGKRHFLLLPKKQLQLMEASSAETEILEIGRWRFSAAAFKQSITYLEAELEPSTEWMILDEIGPLELRDEGFAFFLHRLLKDASTIRKGVILVVRNTALEPVKIHFGLHRFEVKEISIPELAELDTR